MTDQPENARERVDIFIKANNQFRWTNILYIAGTIVLVIGVGVIAESSAMQWAGFIVLLLLAAVAIMTVHPNHTPMTIDEARKRLDKIEARVSADLLTDELHLEGLVIKHKDGRLELTERGKDEIARLKSEEYIQ